MNKKQIIGIGIFVVLVLAIIGMKYINTKEIGPLGNLTTVYVATGGGKEDFLADEEVLKILKKKYKLDNKVRHNSSKAVRLPILIENKSLRYCKTSLGL